MIDTHVGNLILPSEVEKSGTAGFATGALAIDKTIGIQQNITKKINTV